jgi:4-hydroxyphenylpyruvate dioxygenase
VRTSIATVCVSGTLERKLEAVAAAGFDGVEIFENDLVASPSRPAEIRSRAADLGLRIDLYQPFRDFEAVTPDRLRANLRRAESKLTVMEALGAGTLLACSTVQPDAIADDDLAAEQLWQLAERAKERGMRVAYEALAWGRHVDDYVHAWRIVEAADHPQLGICLDSFHILSRGTDPTRVRDIPGEKVFFLQLADAPHLVMDVLQWSRHYRCFPGQGGFDLAPLVADVLAGGYSGPLSLEVFNDVFRQADPRRTAVDALRSLRVLEESVRARLVATRGDEGRALADELRLADPVPAQQPQGFSFVEVAVDERSARGGDRCLRALGFAPVGSHRSKDVRLWRCGGVDVVVNAGDPRLVHDLDGDALVTALAVEVPDPTAAARRAEALLAPVLPRIRGPQEADLAAVAAPDGTSVFFCRTGPDAGSDWRADFVPAEAVPAKAVPAKAVPAKAEQPASSLLTGVDHVGLSQPFDHFDEASLFYRSVLGLEPAESLELAAPDGLVRSRALACGTGRLRIALNVSVLGTDDVGRQVPGPQHVAFATSDVVACARAVRSAGGELLPIPGNYYDDLLARTDLDERDVEAWAELGILYDRSPRGEFWHFYTPMVGRRLFFEVVQRGGGYDGYGAFNAPVRMAAQRRSPAGQVDP